MRFRRWTAWAGFALTGALACSAAGPAKAPSSLELSRPSVTGPSTSASHALNLRLVGAEGREQSLDQVLQHARYTVVVFFSHTCPCVRAHDARVVQIARDYEAQGVQVIMVDSEVGASAARARREQEERGYPFPILVDEDGALAEALRARYASQAVILDVRGAELYAGGIDSDKNFLRDNANPYLRNALNAILRGKPVPGGDHRALGCGLRLR